MMTTRCALGGVLIMLLLPAARTSAQEARVIPGSAYAAGRTKGWLLGDEYRDLWTTAVRVPVLDLDRFAGGLTPLQRGGGRQTSSLRLRGEDGREYAFRSVDKLPALADHPDLRGSLLAHLIQDQVSSIVPAASLVAARLSAAAGLPVALPQLFIMPDDPALGEFREEFAGMLGTIEERPDEREHGEPGLAGFSRIVSTERMLEHLEEDPGHSADERAYLTARLLDLVMGDWDRHEDQWRWGRLRRPPATVWIPIPRDRDYAFSDYDGTLVKLVRSAVPNATRFRKEIAQIEGLVQNAAALDRQLLAWLERPVWDSVAASLQARLTDQVIEEAVHGMPPEHRLLRGAELSRLLRERRDQLPPTAAEWYLHLSRLIEVHTTDKAERVQVIRRLDGSVEVRVERSPEADGPPTLVRRRTIDPTETGELRIFLRGGDDTAVVSGMARRGLLVHIVGGGGTDLLVDESRVWPNGKWTRLYDDGARDRLQGGRWTVIDRREYEPPEVAPRGLFRQLPKQAGIQRSVNPIVDYSSARGVVVGAGVSSTTHAFRRHPYANRLMLDARYSPGWSSFGLRASAHLQSRDPGLSTAARLTASWIDAARYYGFGNETADAGPSRRYVVRRDVFAAAGELRLVPRPGLTLSAGPVLRATQPRRTEGAPLDSIRPLGWDGWSAVGGAASFELRRKLASAGDAEIVASGSGSVNQPLRGGSDPYGDLRGGAAVQVPVGAAWAVARAGWSTAWGGYPFDAAAYLGGRETHRGFPEWRFAGDSMIHGSVESGVPIGRVPLGMNWRTAIFAFIDAGRVFANGETSDRWHSAPGAGVELSALEYSVRITYAHGPSGRIYLETRSVLPR